MYVPSALTIIVPTPAIIASKPALLVTPPTVKVVTVKVATGEPDPESFVKTFPVTGVSSAVLELSSTMVILLTKIKRAALLTKLPQTKSDCDTCKR